MEKEAAIVQNNISAQRSRIANACMDLERTLIQKRIDLIPPEKPNLPSLALSAAALKSEKDRVNNLLEILD